MGIGAFDLSSLQRGIAEHFADRLLVKGFVPTEEWNDALILAEVSLAAVPLLVTSDKHLLDIDPDALRLVFDEADLAPVHVVHPKRLLRALT